MRLQGDTMERVVYLDNLKAMCERVSGEWHRYRVERVTRARVYVRYSNPDQWTHETPFLAVFPRIPANAGDDNRDNPRVLLSIIDTQNEPADLYGEGWQYFDVLLDCPVLWRDSSGEWKRALVTRSSPEVLDGWKARCLRCGVLGIHASEEICLAVKTTEEANDN